MLGEDNIRYKSARLVGRPLLQLARKLRGQPPVASMERPAVKPVYFPHNYRPPAPAELTPDDSDTNQLIPHYVGVVRVDENDASDVVIEALNSQFDREELEWLFIVSDEIREPDCLEALWTLLHAAGPHDDVVFADEPGADPKMPILKSSGVGPHTLLSYNSVGRPALIRRTTLGVLGGFRKEAGVAFEHDAYLRLFQSNAVFHHVAVVLNAGRIPESFASKYIQDATQNVVRDAFRARGVSAIVSPGELPTTVRWRVEIPTPAPSIDIIIPTRDRVDLVRQCLRAIEEKTTYSNYDIIILDNDSKEPETLEFFNQTKYRVIPCPGVFNYAKIVNRGVAHSNADFVLTLNNDTVLLTPDWLEQMLGIALLDDVSIVGACLLDQHGHHEHDSIVISPYPQHLRIDSNYPRLDEFSTSIRDVAAVTGAVQLVQRELWESLGGMDELLRVTMNDVDICLRSQDNGHNVVFTPYVQLHHHVSSTRGSLDPLVDRNRFIRRWDVFESLKDPYFPESLLLLGETVYYRHR